MEKKLNILVTGSNGQLGMCLRDASKESTDNWIFVGHEDLDITDTKAVSDFVLEKQIDVIVNCAAFTNVEKCEGIEYLDIVHRTNVVGPENLAKAIKQTNGTLIHISSDYVFGGADHCSAYEEDDLMTPINRYGRSKVNAERLLATTGCNYLVIRTGWLYSEYGKNFLLTMMDKMKFKPSGSEIKVVVDQIGTPTYAMDLAMFIVGIITNRVNVVPEKQTDTIHEVYNYSDEGVASWYDFACSIKEYGGYADIYVVPCYTFEMNYKAERPAFSVLDKFKVKKTFNVAIPYWRDSLVTCINKMFIINDRKHACI